MCWCESHTPCLFFTLSTQRERKAHTKEKAGKYMVAGQSTALFSILLRCSLGKTREKLSTFSWAVVEWLLATGAWRSPPAAYIHFEETHLNYTYATPNVKRERHWSFTITFSAVAVCFHLLECDASQ